MPVVEVPAVLCQPDPSKSCGACCGMYNHKAEGAGLTMARLRARTEAFQAEADIRDDASLRAFRMRWEPTDGKLVGGLANCPFLGMLDGARVGCMVHPKQNDGLDGRDCGVYDRHICEDYLCAAHAILRPIEKWLVIEACSDSYTYGLVVTDPLFVRQLLEQSATNNGAMPSPSDVMGCAPAAARYFELKKSFPHRAADGVLGQVVGSPDLETPRRVGPSAALGLEPGRWETILRCLGTSVADSLELAAAEELVAAAVTEFSDAVSALASVRALR